MNPYRGLIIFKQCAASVIVYQSEFPPDIELLELNLIFNNCKIWDFMPEVEIDGNQIDLVNEMRILGVVIRADMKWSSNTKYIVERGYSKLWMLRRLKNRGAGQDDLKDVYINKSKVFWNLQCQPGTRD